MVTEFTRSFRTTRHVKSNLNPECFYVITPWFWQPIKTLYIHIQTPSLHKDNLNCEAQFESNLSKSNEAKHNNLKERSDPRSKLKIEIDIEIETDTGPETAVSTSYEECQNSGDFEQQLTHLNKHLQKKNDITPQS